MSVHEKTLNVFINQPDVYRDIDFNLYPQISEVYWDRGKIKDPLKVTALLTGLKDVIDDDFLTPFPNVQYIGSNTTGVDHIRVPEKIKVIHLHPIDVQDISATAEFTLALLLALVRKIPFIDYKNLSDWTFECRGMQLRNKTIGIFGLGRLGKKMARYAEALEMHVSSFDKESTAEDKKRILTTSDIISIHLPLNAETVNFIDDEDFKLMKRKPFLVNTARPQIIRKAALLKALSDDRVSGVAMDFINYDASDRWDPELDRYAGNKLFMTPHIAGNTQESVSYTAGVILRKLTNIAR